MSDNLDTSADQTVDQTKTIDQTTDQTTNQKIDQTLLDTPADNTTQLNGDTWYAQDWRDKMSGGDEKLKTRLERFTDPSKVLDSWLAAEQRIHSGEFKQVRPKDATEEQLATWRAENGVPESPDKYELSFDSGLVIGEGDKEFVDSFLKVAHENNMPTEFVKPAIEWFYNDLKAEEDKQIEKDSEYYQESEDTLRAKWGNDFRANVNAVASFFGDAPESIRDQISRARLPDGTLLGVNPDAMQWLANKERTLNPAATVVPSGPNQAQSMEDELKVIRDRMATDMEGYRKDTAQQKRFEELLELQQKLKQK